jgi:glutamate racemase
MERSASLPIGVFDSGLGGLTVLRALREKLPAEDFVYLGDVARLPYGTKSQSVVQEYARQCVQFLLKQPVKAVVVACNTASAMALDVLRSEVAVPVWGVVDPGVRASIEASQGRGEGVLVLATESTVRSEAYPKAIAQQDPTLKVTQLACPLLVALAEEGWFDTSVTEQVIRHYLSQVELDAFSCVVLGCTHFPLLEASFRKVLPNHLILVHGAQALADEMSVSLAAKGLLKPTGMGLVKLVSTDKLNVRVALLRGWLDQVTEFQTVSLGLCGKE